MAISQSITPQLSLCLAEDFSSNRVSEGYLPVIIILGSHKTSSGNTIMIAKQIIIIATKGTIDL
jgi:hypothetical protein